MNDQQPEPSLTEASPSQISPIVKAQTPDPPAAKRHHDACRCVRCVGFEAGHTLSVRHGAYARLQLSEKAAETAEVLRELLPVYQESDEPLLQAFGYVLEQR